MTTYDFDRLVERRGTSCHKWDRYAGDVLPMWVADMDFPAAPEIVDALRRRLDHPVLGYGFAPDNLRRLIVDRMADSYGWTVSPEAIVFVPGVVPAFNVALRSIVAPGEALAVETPVYPPILAAARQAGLERLDVPLVAQANRYATDLDALSSALDRAKAFLMCNPHNPVGQVKTSDELAAIADRTLASGSVIISDEIHCDIVYSGHRHVPIAALSPEIADRTITLMAASKTYNIAGLDTAFAIIPDAALRERFSATRAGLVGEPNVLGLVATEAALAHGGDWKAALLAYLEGNRNYLASEMKKRFPGLRLIAPEGTFLAWLDARPLDLGVPAQRFFLENAKVAFNAGQDFATGFDGFVRLNFGCPRALLDAGLDRMEAALADH